MNRQKNQFLALLLTISGVTVVGCSSGAASSGASVEASSPAPAVEVAPASAAPVASALAAPVDSSCVAPGCRTFATSAEAFEAVLASKPLVVGIGEAHTQKEAAGAPTTAKRFTVEILPGLKGRASDLLVEILMPPSGCQKTTKEVREAHAPVTEKQAASNQNDYVAMGEASRKLGIVPDLLRPTCADLAAVTAAGADAVPKTLETIARLSVAQTKASLGRKDRKPESMVLLYGGALHNDKEPPAERAAWSYGKDVAAVALGRYVEVDVFSADQIKDDDTWKKQPWITRYDKSKLEGKVTLLAIRPDAFVLILPGSP
jgi:hypothetical protein